MIRSACSDKNHPLLKLLSQNSSLILYPEHPRVTGLTCLIIFHLYTDPINQLSPHAALLWKHAVGKTAASSERQQTHTRMGYITYMSTIHHSRPSHCAYRFHTLRHMRTNIQESSHQTLLILSQGSQQRRVKWWIKARIRGEQKADEQKQVSQDGVSL